MKGIKNMNRIENKFIELKKINKNVKIIVVSTYYEGTEECDRIKACGIDRYYSKPISPDVLIDEIKRLTKVS